MVHIDNIPYILKNGITHRRSPNRDPNFRTIGDVSLIATRNEKQVYIDNGEDAIFNVHSIVLGNFIPFYFGVKMPMLYVMQHGGNFVAEPTPAEDIVYIVCKLGVLVQNYTGYYFSDGHATDNLTSFYDQSKILELPNIVDWQAIRTTYWGGHDNLNLKRKKQAEFLQSRDIATEHIEKFGCYNMAAKQKLIGMGVREQVIQIGASAYY